MTFQAWNLKSKVPLISRFSRTFRNPVRDKHNLALTQHEHYVTVCVSTEKSEEGCCDKIFKPGVCGVLGGGIKITTFSEGL